MIKLYAEQKVSLYRICCDTNIKFNVLYRYANKECNIKNMPFTLLSVIANYCNLQPIELYSKMKDYLYGGSNE